MHSKRKENGKSLVYASKTGFRLRSWVGEAGRPSRTRGCRRGPPASPPRPRPRPAAGTRSPPPARPRITVKTLESLLFGEKRPQKRVRFASYVLPLLAMTLHTPHYRELGVMKIRGWGDRTLALKRASMDAGPLATPAPPNCGTQKPSFLAKHSLNQNTCIRECGGSFELAVAQ